MPRPQEMVWLCNNSPKTYVVGDVTLKPYCCAGFPIDLIEEGATAEAVAANELCIHSGYFEGQQVADACPQFSLKQEAMLHAAAEYLGVARSDLHPGVVSTINDYVNAGALNTFEQVPEVAEIGKREAEEQIAREKREKGEEVEAKEVAEDEQPARKTRAKKA